MKIETNVMLGEDKCYIKYTNMSQAVVPHAFNPSTLRQKQEFLSARPAWSAEPVPGRPGARTTQRNYLMVGVGW